MTARVTDAGFMESVLEPYAITIRNRDVSKNLRKHFCIQELPYDPKDRLDYYKKMLMLSVWLEFDEKCIQREYRAMSEYESNEAEHSAYALCDIFLDEPRHLWPMKDKGDQLWLPVRML